MQICLQKAYSFVYNFLLFSAEVQRRCR